VSITGGYFSSKAQLLPIESLREWVSGYRILPSDAGTNFLTDVLRIRFGHLISKHKIGYRHRTPTIVDQDGNVLVISGYLFPPGADDADAYRRLLLRCVETGGKALETCEGEFVGLFAEGRSGTLHIVNDRFGSCPFYFLQTGDDALFSSSLPFLSFLADGRLESDVLGWLQIFTLKRTLGTRTHLRNVRRLLPASHVTLSREGARETPYWRLRHEVDENPDPEDTARRVFDAFRGATKRRAERLGKGIIALSGGLDSRLLAGALPVGSEFSAFTFVDSLSTADTLEVRTAAEISRILGIPHLVKPVPRGAMSPQLIRDIIALTAGLIPVHHTVKTMQCLAAIKEHGADTQMGAAPAALRGRAVPSVAYLDPVKTDRCVRAYAKKEIQKGALLWRFFRSDVLHEYYPQLGPSVMETFEAVDGPTAIHRLTAWSATYAQGGSTFTCPTHNHPDVTEAQPHLGYDFTDLMLRLPAAWLYKRTFYKFMIVQCLPQLREVVYANTGERLSGELIDVHAEGSERWRDSYVSVRRFVGHKLRAAGVPSLHRSNSFLYALVRDSPELLNDVTEMLHSKPSLSELLDVEKCIQFVQDCRNGRRQGDTAEDDAHMLATLSTLCYVFERFDRPATGTQAPAPIRMTAHTDSPVVTGAP